MPVIVRRTEVARYEEVNNAVLKSFTEEAALQEAQRVGGTMKSHTTPSGDGLKFVAVVYGPDDEKVAEYRIEYTRDGVYENVPNFDGMSREDIVQWIAKYPHDKDLKKYAAEMFPDRPAEYVEAFQLLLLYANHKAGAMRLRAQGEIEKALGFERACDNNYAELPPYARW